MREISPGFYDDEWGGLHIDVDEYVRAAGGDPANPEDVETALRVVRETAEREGIPLVEVEE